nr:MAG TPA: Major capsid protein [Microviridae sp.]
MAKQPYISHVVNGYSRYDLPESVAFTCTPGILYPVRVDFINARDRVTIDQGIDVRSNPLAVPSFNPYTVRLHRFWVPLQLYHPEMRTNSSSFDMNDLSLNWIPYALVNGTSSMGAPGNAAFSNSLLSWLYFA